MGLREKMVLTKVGEGVSSADIWGSGWQEEGTVNAKVLP